MRKDAELNHKNILQAAQDLYMEQGLQTTTMKAIAKRANVGVGTLYRNYESKSALYFELVQSNMSTFISSSVNYLSTTKEDKKTCFQTVLHYYIDFREANRGILAEIDSDSNQMSIFYQSALYQQLVALLEKVLAPLNPLDNATQLIFKADMLIAMLKSDSFAFQRDNRHLSPSELVDFLIYLFSR